MGVPTSEVGYTSATTGRGDHEVHKGHVVALGGGKGGLFRTNMSITFIIIYYQPTPGIINSSANGHNQLGVS
jgi:hypothetical protein